MENCLAADRDDRIAGHAGPLVLERGPATNPLFGAFFEAAVQAGYPLTDDVNGYRQEGFAPFDRNVRNGRRLSASRAYLRPAMSGQNLTVLTRASSTASVLTGTRATGVDLPPQRPQRSGHGRRGDPVRRRDQHPAAPATLGGRQPPNCGPSDHRRAARPARRGREPAGPPRGLHPVRLHRSRSPCSPTWQVARSPFIGANGAGPEGPAATNHFEGGGFVRQQRRRRVPEPDVPLPADRGALRRLGRRQGGARLPGARRADVLRRPRHGEDRSAATRRVHPALRFNYLSTDQDRREWVEAIRVARDILNQPAMAPFNGGETLPRPVGVRPMRRSWTGWPRDAETALHPSCTAKMGTDDRWRWSTRRPCGCTASTDCGWSTRR